MASFLTGKLRKTNLFWTNKDLFSISTAQTEKNSWKKISETKW